MDAAEKLIEDLQSKEDTQSIVENLTTFADKVEDSLATYGDDVTQEQFEEAADTAKSVLLISDEDMADVAYILACIWDYSDQLVAWAQAKGYGQDVTSEITVEDARSKYLGDTPTETVEDALETE